MNTAMKSDVLKFSSTNRRVSRLTCFVFLVSAGVVVVHSFSIRYATTLPKVTNPIHRREMQSFSQITQVAAATAAYARQHEAADRLVSAMRATPNSWVSGSYHQATGAVWVDPFRDFYRCPGVLEKVGPLSDGGKWVCGVDTLLQRRGCVIYSFGSNGDTSFEEAMLNATKCSVWTFDPTLDAAKLAKVKAVPGINFAPVGLADRDGNMTIAGKVLPVRTLHTLMGERGHTWVDLLKMDIEGGEWAVMDGLVRRGSFPPISQAQIEFHADKPQQAVETMARLVGAGWRVFHVEENNYCGEDNYKCAGRLYELSLAQVDAAGLVVVET